MTPSHSSFFSNDAATSKIYTLSLHDALPILRRRPRPVRLCRRSPRANSRFAREARARTRPLGHPWWWHGVKVRGLRERSEEHTSELQSRPHLVCRLLLEKKKKIVRSVITMVD